MLSPCETLSGRQDAKDGSHTIPATQSHSRRSQRLRDAGVRYLLLTHNQRHPVSGTPVARTIYGFGRADELTRTAQRPVVRSIIRFMRPAFFCHPTWVYCAPQ